MSKNSSLDRVKSTVDWFEYKEIELYTRHFKRTSCMVVYLYEDGERIAKKRIRKWIGKPNYHEVKEASRELIRDRLEEIKKQKALEQYLDGCEKRD